MTAERRIKLLDLFCGGGGGALGYHRAGIADITGIDISRKPRYPYTFIQTDALTYLQEHWQEYDAIHASPPCQKWVPLSQMRDNPREHGDFLTPTMQLLPELGKPYIVENVQTAPMPSNLMLCGSMFDLPILRHRKFATNFFVPQLPCRHDEQDYIIGVYGSGGIMVNERGYATQRFRNRKEAADAMGGLHWMKNIKEITEAIPPAYTEYIGRYLIEYIEYRREECPAPDQR